MEKEDGNSVELITLETGGEEVCGGSGDWRDNVDAEVTADLRKYRSYRGESVRDLLRALRNKVVNCLNNYLCNMCDFIIFMCLVDYEGNSCFILFFSMI